MTLPDDPRGRELELIIERAKYERWLMRETELLVEREFNELVDVILSPKFRSLTQFGQRRKLQLFRELDELLQKGYGNIADFHIREMKVYADLESEIARAQAFSVIPSDQQLRISAGAFLPGHTIKSIAALPIQGLKIGEWWHAQAQNMSRETRRTIQNGLVEGKPAIEISRQIISTPKDATPQVVRRARNEARMISRTTVTAVQNHAAIESYKKLPEEVSDSYRYTAIRDSRTSAICRALDGKIFKNDDPKAPRPPQHINCRSSIMPILKDVDESLRVRNPNAAPTFASYNEWLKSRSTAEQDRILGKAQAALWRSGKMTLADTIDADNRVLTLAQLKKKLNVEELVEA